MICKFNSHETALKSSNFDLNHRAISVHKIDLSLDDGKSTTRNQINHKVTQ